MASPQQSAGEIDVGYSSHNQPAKPQDPASQISRNDSHLDKAYVPAGSTTPQAKSYGYTGSADQSAPQYTDTSYQSQLPVDAQASLQGQEQDPSWTTDDDSAFGGGDSLIDDDTTSLRSYITDYIYENGRRYHAYKDGAYWGPNDDEAAEIIDYAHHMYLITLDQQLHLVPLSNPHEILDVGTGTGIWAIEMAELYPTARVTGTDLSPIQPIDVPPNLYFEVDDARLDWTFPENTFDFVHVRELFGCIPDWDFFFEEAFKCIKPGGWIEVVEHSVEPISSDGSVTEDHFFTTWGKTVMEMGRRRGCTFGIWREAKQKLEAAGFVDVTEVGYVWPMNGWSHDRKLHEIGRWNQARLHHGIEGFMLRMLTNVGGWSTERAQLFLAEMRRCLRDYRTHAYLPGTVVYARKPMG